VSFVFLHGGEEVRCQCEALLFELGAGVARPKYRLGIEHVQYRREHTDLFSRCNDQVEAGGEVPEDAAA